jgi:hypothetical protein
MRMASSFFTEGITCIMSAGEVIDKGANVSHRRASVSFERTHLGDLRHNVRLLVVGVAEQDHFVHRSFVVLCLP